jgi:hypothetical protein
MKELIFQGSVDERNAAKIKLCMIAKIKIGSLPDQKIMLIHCGSFGSQRGVANKSGRRRL